MRKRLISICAIAIQLYGIYGCAQTDEGTFVTEPGTMEAEYTDEEGIKPIADAIAGQEEFESVKDGILYEHTLSGKMWFYYSTEEIPYVDEETFELIRQAYDEVDYSAEFAKGNSEVYEEYKQKFRSLIQNEVPFLDKETGKELYIKDWMELHGLIVLQDFKAPYTYRYYFFDMNGDGAPELCVEDVVGLVFAYDPDTDQCILWTWLNGKDIVGTRTAVWNPEYDTDIYEFFRLDLYGNVELDTLFWAEYEDLYHDDINMVMFPNYADREKRWEITDEMKKQGVFEESSGQWFFRITVEQFEELAKPYMEARQLARERSREESYTYDELFGEYETE